MKSVDSALLLATERTQESVVRKKQKTSKNKGDMDKTFLDECFKARMDHLRKRFPIESFRRLFKHQYVRYGLVMIQPIVNKDMDDVMTADSEAGFIFNSEHNLDVALRLLRLWGFSVTMRQEHDERRTYTAYIVQLPDDYLTHHVGSERAGIVRTGLRTLRNVDRTKIQKPSDWDGVVTNTDYTD